MNLKSKLQHRLTATVKFVTDCNAIYSDECSATHISALTIMIAETKDALWSQIKDKARETAATTKFAPIIGVITPDDKFIVIKLETAPASDYVA